ncbi:MAG: phenylalanine--tRNA ligase subunit alpha [Bryobacterales bacterium]|nr:phenylalanine--tRNA ligase subunit alpha [Bryobacterales bacterium]MDE0262243.1 phenylalanine--tRNA ligase subunit alpha [Bryobacterales bacterium]MDE0624741.1 phenylalanine--tRNA ligase subunit alpha [Bryobacterales bacterium]
MSIERKTGRPIGDLIREGDDPEQLYGELRAAFERECSQAVTPQQGQALRDRWLGRRSGLLSATNDHWLKAAPRELKPVVGKLQNLLRRDLEAAVKAAAEATVRERVQAEPDLDTTLPGPERSYGAVHPARLALEEVLDIFRPLGYTVAEGPEIETFYYNFEALNFPPDHPAVDEMDTLFLKDGALLRTHTSPCQIRIMESKSPPLRYVVHGKVYRNDTPDATHSPMFHQLEMFAVDESITFGDLKGTLEHFVRCFFGPQTEARFRPSFFPFTEPSAEVDITCPFCTGSGCRICKQTGFIEVLGCGMIDPNVLRNAGLDPERYQGFAAGFGLDRFAMLKYSIDDIPLMYQGDARFLRQFR